MRDDAGVFAAAMCRNFQDVLSLLQAEAMAIRGPFRLNEIHFRLSPMGQILEDTKALLPTITEVTCTHIRRQANNLVHRSAR